MLVAYTDGSFSSKTGKVGWGFVLLNGDTVIHEEYGSIDEYTEMRNVVGECYAMIQLVSYCEEQGITDLLCYVDYQGVKCWYEGTWKCKNGMTQRYRRFMLGSPINIQIEWVRGHDGNKWNERADDLAKRGSGLE